MSELVARIEAAYRREAEHNREAVAAQDLPLSFESITSRWLTAVLCPRAPGAEVLSHRLGQTDNGSSNRRRIALTYNDAGRAAGLPEWVFCKATHGLTNRIILGVSGGARSEALFYNGVRRLLAIEAPIGYFAACDPETFNSMVMLADLTGKAQAFCDHKTVMTRKRVESQLRLLATLHGRCYSDETLRRRTRDFPTFRHFFSNTLKFGLRESAAAGFLAAEAVVPARLFRRHAEIWPATVAAVEASDALPHTLTHGDVHLKNWYVALSGEMGLGDWQCAARSHWGRDFAYAVATALAVKDRRAWERELLAYYLDRLALAGGPVTDIDTAWNIYRQQLASALAWWTITLCPTPGMPDMQPRDVSLEFIRRIATAMDDVDSLDI
jgi:hypothetical protein